MPRPFRLDLGDGHFLAGDELAGDGPTYAFLHGLGSVRQGVKSTSLLAHAQQSGRAFVRVDLRGHGESSGTIGLVKPSALIDDVVRLLQRLGPTVVVGSSLGGLVGAMAAAACPQQVVGLGLLAPAFGLMNGLADRLDAQGQLRTSDGRSFPVAADVLADARAIDERSLPRRLAVPTLLVHGTADDVIPQQVSERFFQALAHPQKELWLVPGGDHRLADVADAIWPRLDALLAR